MRIKRNKPIAHIYTQLQGLFSLMPTCKLQSNQTWKLKLKKKMVYYCSRRNCGQVVTGKIIVSVSLM